jgi:flagellar motility protein MotE (MotC chaperone)
MKTIFTIIIVILLIHRLALLGLLGYGAATGRFDSEKKAQYLATWQGEKLIPETQEVEAVEETETPAQASERIAASETLHESLSRETQRDIELSRYMQSTIEQAKIKIEQDLQQLQTDRAAFEAEIAQHNKLVEDEGFQKALKSYSQLKPKLVKEDFMNMEENEVLQYLSQMKSDVLTKILEQFKTPDEQQKRLRLMKMLTEYRSVKLTNNDKS